jgi:cation transport regulator ChaC
MVRNWPLARAWYWMWGLKLDGQPHDDVWYFAYGANMHSSIFRDRRKIRPTDARPGRVGGYRLRFNLDGRPIGRAAPANITADPNGEVWGVFYQITRRQLVRLNASEGIPGWRYRPVELAAEDGDGKAMTVTGYIADGNAEDGNPSLRYITLLREGAREHGLPDHWISHLDNIHHAE